jgi:hypothetical protein
MPRRVAGSSPTLPLTEPVDVKPKVVAEAAQAPARPDAFSAKGSVPAEQFDPRGFLSLIGMPDEAKKMAGYTDADFFRAFKGSGYHPGLQYFPGPKWLGEGAQKLFLALSGLTPDGAAKLSAFANRFIKDSMSDPAVAPYGEMLDSAKAPVAARERYIGVSRVLADDNSQAAFEADFHEGSIARTGKPGYGTYDLARALGFSDVQATRIAREDFNVDTNQTGLKGKDGQERHTKSASGGDLQFHFNRAPRGEEDTRITAARTHLGRAVTLAREQKFDAAENELGLGLHSLQDMFAHGQLTPIGHTVLDGFPDVIQDRPETAREAQLATFGYLTRYLDSIGVSGDVPEPRVTVKAEPLSLETALASLPAELRQQVRDAGLQVVLTDDKVRPTDLGFGFDANGDSVIDGEGRDIDGDGVVSPAEQEDRREDGRKWNDIPAGYDATRQLVYVERAAVADGRAPALLRHELSHVLVQLAARTPEGREAITRTWQMAVERGELDREDVRPREYLAEALSKLDDAKLVAGVKGLTAGEPFAGT